MEAGFGQDFGRIRVHDDSQAAASSRAVNAAAYAVGEHVVFGEGEYAPGRPAGRNLIVHELAHTAQQRLAPTGSSLEVGAGQRYEDEARAAVLAVSSRRPMPRLSPAPSASVARQTLAPDQLPPIERDFELDPRLFLKQMSANAVPEKCKEFPGGSTDCEVDAATGTPTGKVITRIDETNPCTRPCVVKHEAVHFKQMTTLCPALRDCCGAADKGKRPATDCYKMAMTGGKLECEAYTVSVPCTEQRVKSAPECKSADNQRYGAEKLQSEKCFRDQYCAGPKKP